MTYFLYARKSTDVEDKQVLSIDGQLAELREIAKRDNLQITEEFIEKRSAKKPGRPVFNDMLRRIERGEAQGIVCWKIDRLARNPVDGGQIQWLLQQGVICNIQTHDRSYLPNDNVLMMSVELGMANEYIRQLSANTSRGLKHKARMGIYPGLAPFGYINNPLTKSVNVERKNAKLIKKTFAMYATGKVRLEDLADLWEKAGVLSKGNRRVHISRISFILQNPFYYGHFRYCGEVYEGKHEPIITKDLRDSANAVLRGRGCVPNIENDPAPYCGLLRCGGCGMGITAETREKHQKNGNVHHYVYYRCTRKNKTHKCHEAPVRSEILDRQLSALVADYAMPKDWVAPLLAMLDKEAVDAKQTASAAVQGLREEVAELSRNLARLTDVYVAQDIERDDYLERRRTLMSEKKSVEEQIARLERTPSAWIEPARNWIRDASMLDEIAKNFDLPSKKSSLQKIFGLNLALQSREARGIALNPWLELRSSRSKIGKMDLCLILEPTPGFEPGTYSFAYTSVSYCTIGRLDCIFLHTLKSVETLVSRSSAYDCATVLACAGR
ncbi:MAG TPA: recombinase family protein [Candidatus Paceibacterota bacterium]|nr:recombinase family protein [Candidatus Paceibacterota bacterium]